MKKNQLLFLIVACLASPTFAKKKTSNSSQPNILLLLADDMGYGELGCYGQKIIQTPHLDQLATHGIRFTDFYAGNAVCSPSRASLITGKHSGHATIRGNVGLYANEVWDRVPLKKEEPTLAEMVKAVGYQTGFVGKWHLEVPEDLSGWAISRGFDYAVQEQWSGSTGRNFNPLVHWKNGWSDSIVYDPEKYDCLDVFRTDLAFEFLDQKSKEKPFFLFMSYRSPHGHETYIREKTRYADRGWIDAERRHASRITMLDEQINRLLTKLKEDGDLDNTIVIFTSDNGPTNEGHDYKFFNSAGIYRGFKRDLYEGGIRVPMIVYWKGKIKPGRTTDHPSTFCDLMPTFAEISGAVCPETTDGISFLPVLKGEKQSKHPCLYWEELEHFLPQGGFRQAVRMGKWKGVRYAISAETELYNLEIDPSEKTNLATDYPEKVSEINRIFIEARIDNQYFPFGGILKLKK
jgi:arylsulfatase A-like enzyme